MFSNSFKQIIRGSVLLLIIFAFSSTVYALDEYTLLAPIPCTSTGDVNCTNSGTTATLQSYLPGAFKLAIGLSAVLAFVMITYGGIIYATSDAIGKTEQGRTYITNAVSGLLLVIGAWAILYTINPKMLEFNLTLPVPKLQEASNYVSVIKGMNGAVVPGYTLTPELQAENQKVKDKLWNSNSNTATKIKVLNGPCADGSTKGCTNLVGLPDNAISGVEQLNKECNCEIMITGGTEGGHVTHGPGKAAMDLGKSTQLDAFIQKNKVGDPIPKPPYGIVYNVKMSNGQVVQYLDESAAAPGSSAWHWHVVFP